MSLNFSSSSSSARPNRVTKPSAGPIRKSLLRGGRAAAPKPLQRPLQNAPRASSSRPSSSRPPSLSLSSSSPLSPSSPARASPGSSNLRHINPTYNAAAAAAEEKRKEEEEEETNTLPYIPACTLLLGATPPCSRPRDVLSALSWIEAHTFVPFPARGIWYQKLPSLHQFRTRKPPFVSIHYLNGVLSRLPPVAVGRQIDGLVQQGKIRRFGVSGHEGIVVVKQFEEFVRRMVEGVDGALKERYLEVLRESRGSVLPGGRFTVEETDALVKAGLAGMAGMGLGAAPASSASASGARSSTLTSIASLPTSSFSIPTPTSSSLPHSSSPTASLDPNPYAPLLPSLGPFLALLSRACTAVKNSIKPAYADTARTVTVKELREKWDGPPGTVPGRSRCWNEFKGLAFEAVLAEVLGREGGEVVRTVVGMGVMVV